MNNRRFFWLWVSLGFGLYYGLCFYHQAFTHQYIIQDDARQHIVWLQRFSDPQLFPQDLIADYFQSLAPIGYKTLYWLFAKIGIEPLFLAKILPPVLGLLTTIYIYLFSYQILPVASSAFISSLLVNQLIWLNDDLVSATPRAFVYPLLAAFLYYLAQEKIFYCLILMLLAGIFYPHLILIEITVLTIRLLTINKRFIVRFNKSKSHYILWIAGLIITAIALYPVTLNPQDFATTVTSQQMQQMPEFNLGGRTPFFGGSWFNYWFAGNSGLALPIFPTIVWCGLGLPWLLATKLRQNTLITQKIAILQQLTIASFLMFALAHLTLPLLHLPSRFTYHSLRVVLAVASAIVLTVPIDAARNWLARKNLHSWRLRDKIQLTIVTLFALTLIIFPAVPTVFINWFQNWRVGTATEIYQYLARQPKDTLVASISTEVNNIPAFAERSILVGSEFAMAYHPAYYRQIQQRAIALLKAQYSSDLTTVKSFIQEYNVDYLLLHRQAFTPQYLQEKNWLVNNSRSAEIERIIEELSNRKLSPALSKLIPACSVVRSDRLVLLSSDCILARKIYSKSHQTW